MTVAMAGKIISLSNRKNMMTKLMKSQLENIMKSKAMKKI